MYIITVYISSLLVHYSQVNIHILMKAKAKAIIPQNFDLNAHLVRYSPSLYDFTEDSFKLDHALWLLTQLNLAPAQDKELLDQMDFNDFVPLHSNYLQTKVHDYTRYFTYFINTYVLETDNHYIREIDQPGHGKSIGYRFAHPYATCVELKNVDYGTKFADALSRKAKKSYQDLKATYRHLLTWIYPHNRFTIDYDLALKYATLKWDYFLTYPERRKQVFNKKKGDYVDKDPLAQYKSTKSNLLQLQNNTLHFTIDLKGQRLHTNLSKEYRDFITYNGDYIVSYDIKNSQPYLLTSLFNKSLYNIEDKSKLNLYNINTKLNNILPDCLLMTEYVLENIDNQEVEFYESLVSNVDNNPSDLYVYMQKEYRKEGIRDYAERKEVKNVMYEVLFTANRFSTDVKRHFEKLFPSVNNVIQHYKHKDKTALPCLLQSIESHLVLKTITKRFAERCPKAPIITIHDSIATTEKYADKLKPILEKELKRFTGLPPKIEVEKWHPNNIDWKKYQI